METSSGRLLKAGVNCWHIDDAEGIGVVVDVADYFNAFAAFAEANWPGN